MRRCLHLFLLIFVSSFHAYFANSFIDRSNVVLHFVRLQVSILPIDFPVRLSVDYTLWTSSSLFNGSCGN